MIIDIDKTIMVSEWPATVWLRFSYDCCSIELSQIQRLFLSLSYEEISIGASLKYRPILSFASNQYWFWEEIVTICVLRKGKHHEKKNKS